MAAEPGRVIATERFSQGGQPVVGRLRPAWQAGRIRALGEALDDARVVLAFLQAGMRSRCINPGYPLWVIDLSPGDGERAWHLLRIFDAEAPRGPPLRYLACCPDAAQFDALNAQVQFAQWKAVGRLRLTCGERALPSHPLHNPVVVLAHQAFSAHAQHLFRQQAGQLLQAWRDIDGQVRWRDPERRDGHCRLLHGLGARRDGLLLTLPHAGMTLLDAILRASGGRMLLRATDDGLFEQERIADVGLRGDSQAPAQVNFEALARWHRANGGQVLQSRSLQQGQVLHHGLHDVTGGRLRECLPELQALPHPDEHVEQLGALSALSYATLPQGIALLRAHGGDPRALAALVARLTKSPVSSEAAGHDVLGATWLTLVAWSESLRYSIDCTAGSAAVRHE